MILCEEEEQGFVTNDSQNKDLEEWMVGRTFIELGNCGRGTELVGKDQDFWFGHC